MKTSDIDKKIKLVDMENFFDVVENSRDIGRPYVYNLNSTIYFDGVPRLEYTISHDSFWTIISYEIYGTTRLWWVLMKVNNVNADNLFQPVRAGETIKYLDKDFVRDMIVQYVTG